jgi:hypothetical protein
VGFAVLLGPLAAGGAQTLLALRVLAGPLTLWAVIEPLALWLSIGPLAFWVAYVLAILAFTAPAKSVDLLPLLPGQALARRLLFPIRPHVDLVSPAAALGALHARAKPRHLGVCWIA